MPYQALNASFSSLFPCSFCSSRLFALALHFNIFFTFRHFIRIQTEQIRRVNRLFAQDSLFLREHLMIPVDRDTSTHHNQFTKSMSLPTNVDCDFDFSNDCGTSHQSSVASNAATNVHDNMLSPEEENKKSIEDFLGKIDSNLAKTKNYVKNR